MAGRSAEFDGYEIIGEPIDTTERLRRYRVLLSDGRTEMLTRAELDELRAGGPASAQRRARTSPWRIRPAAGLALGGLLVAASIVGRELIPGTAASAIPPLPTQPAHARTQSAATPATMGGQEESAARSSGFERRGASEAVAAGAAVEDALDLSRAAGAGAMARQAVADGLESGQMRAEENRQDASNASVPATVISATGDTARVSRELSEAPHHAADAVFERWLRAWRARDADVYLSLYDEGFARWGLPADAWERARRNRLLSVDWIKVDVEDLVRDAIRFDTIRYTFRQRYRDPGYSDESLKVLVLEERSGRWLITAESDRVVRRGPD